MIRTVASMLAVVTLLAGAGQARAEVFDLREIMGGGPNFRDGGFGGSSPIPRQTVNFMGNYAPGTIYINTARNQGPHQTFRTVHHSTPVREAFLNVRKINHPLRVSSKVSRALLPSPRRCCLF